VAVDVWERWVEVGGGGGGGGGSQFIVTTGS